MFNPKRIVYFFSLFLLLALILAPVSPARAAAVLYAAPSAVGNGDCSSWANACTLQYALSQAVNGDEIWVKAGVHYPGTAGNRDATFTLKNGVALYGGFGGGESSRDDRDWTTNKTILSGDIDKNDTDTNSNGIIEPSLDDSIKGDNAYHVVTGSGTDNTAVLDGFIITAGQANSSHNDACGGGMYSSSGSPKLTNVIFIGNSASYGGGMYNDFSSPTLTNVTFSENLAVKSGGGMYNESDSSPTLMDVTFSSNSADYGGGMENDFSELTLTNVTFSGNSAGYGGGMYNLSSSPTLTNVAFSGNSATYDGGGMANEKSSPKLTNVAFSGNSADNSGGGMDNYESSPTLTNVIMWGDIASNGPEIYNDGSSAPVVTYSDIEGCIVSGSWNSACGTDGGSNINAGPLFVDADGLDNIAGTADDNLRLGFGSPVIDSGNNTAVPVNVTTDLDGLPRKADGNSDSDPVVDMGAYEAGQMFCGVETNTAYTFDKNSNVVITTTATLGDLSCLYVDEMELNHPNATAGIQTGRYWLIRGLKSDKTDATGFSVNLTLPTTFTPGDNDKVCRYTGSGQVWDCAADSHTDNSITRNGVSAFSDWAVGNNVGPTAIKLQDFQASSAPSPLVWLIPAALAIAILLTKKRLAKP